MGKTVGIDLGTYNSAVAYINKHGEVEIIPASEGAGKLTTPSVVLFEGDEVIVGQTAKQSAVLDRDHVADYFKRHVGDENWKFEVDGKCYSPTDLQSYVLKKLKKDAEQFLNDTVESAVITVPAHFSLQQRKLVEEAAKLADLEVKQIINEPTAAAIEYGIENLELNSRVLVYDLGGGTFDVTIMQKDVAQGDSGDVTSALKVINNAGEAELGGTDWDERIREHVIATHIEQHGAEEDPSEDLATFQDLTDKAESAKITLSNRSSVKLGVSYNGKNTQLELTRDKFEEITDDLMERTRTILDNAIAEAIFEQDRDPDDKKKNIDIVLMVGGSCNMPMVEKALTAYFEGTNAKVVKAPSLDFMVVKGATKITSDKMPGGPELPVIKEVLNHSVGVLVLNQQGKQVVSRLLPKNEDLGRSKSEIYYTASDGATSIRIALYEGESEDPEMSTAIGDAFITGLPPGRPAGQPIKVTLTSTDSGTVDLEALDQNSNQKVTATMHIKDIKDDDSIRQRKQELDEATVSS
jgi:molecular chaperone DnaK